MPSPFRRVLSAVRRALSGTPEARPEQAPDAPQYAGGYAVSPAYDLEALMSSYAAFAWVYAAVSAKSEDLAGIPLIAERGDGAATVRLDRHPALDLLAQPTSDPTAPGARQQQIVDLLLAGQSWRLILYAGRLPVALRRLHPEYTRPVPDPSGLVRAWEYAPNGAATYYDPSAVLWDAAPSWESSPEGLYGTGAIRPLRNKLAAELAAEQRLTQAARVGRPDAILTPAAATTGGQAGSLDPGQVKQLSDRINRVFAERNGGVVVLNEALELRELSFSPADLEFSSLRQETREAILAVVGVPPTRLQLPTANYAQSTDAMTQYWESLRRLAAKLELNYSKLARAFPGSENVRIRHDFSSVAYLQADRTERLSRVSVHIANGIPPAQAYAYEGFADAPVPPPPAAPQAAFRGMPRPDTEADRRALYAAWRRLRDRSSDAIARALQGWQAGAWKRRKGDEAPHLRGALGGPVFAAARVGYRNAARQAGAPDGAIPSHDGRLLLDGLVALVLADWRKRSKDKAGATDAIAAGRLADLAATRALNAGAHAAIVAAGARKEWLAHRGGDCDHLTLDGRTCAADGSWSLGLYPGAGDEPCACTLFPSEADNGR